MLRCLLHRRYERKIIEMNIPLDQIVAYAVTIISLTLFVLERKRNVKKPIYMALQGLLKSTYVKFQCHNAQFGMLANDPKHKDRQICLEEYTLYAQMVQSDFQSQIEQILGVMESLEIKDSAIIDSEKFTGHKARLKEYEEKLQSKEMN